MSLIGFMTKHYSCLAEKSWYSHVPWHNAGFGDLFLVLVCVFCVTTFSWAKKHMLFLKLALLFIEQWLLFRKRSKECSPSPALLQGGFIISGRHNSVIYTIFCGKVPRTCAASQLQDACFLLCSQLYSVRLSLSWWISKDFDGSLSTSELQLSILVLQNEVAMSLGN